MNFLNNYRLIPLLSGICLVLIAISCNTTDSTNIEFEDGISIPIKEFLSDELLIIIEEELMVPIHRGKNPPNIVAMLAPNRTDVRVTVLMKPTVLVRTNVPEAIEITDQPFNNDTFFRFENQNMDNYTIDYYQTNLGEQPFVGEGSYIIGSGNKFTVVGFREDVVQQDTIRSVNYFSGIIEGDGISSATGGILMIDNHGNQAFIPNGTGRSFKDEDGFSMLDDWPFTKALKTKVEKIVSNKDGFDIRVQN